MGRERGNDTIRNTGHSGRQKVLTQTQHREERLTVQGPIRILQPDGMSHRGFNLLLPIVPLKHRSGQSHLTRMGCVTQVYEIQPADSSQPSIFTPLSLSAYSHCASCTLGNLWAWQSPTA